MTEQLPSLLISIPEGVIDLGWGHPSPSLHPTEAIRTAANHALFEGSVTALQYGATQGFGPLLESLAGFLSQEPAYAMAVSPRNLFISSGASQALDLATTLFARPGDTVFVEEPSYYLIESIFRDHGLNVVGVPTDEYGLRIDALEAMLADADIPNPTLLYIIPTYQNPSGVVLTVERRQKLVELAAEHDFTVLADEVYQLLHYGDPPPPPLVAYDPSDRGCVVSIGSFSKILAPGLRIGWVQGNPRLISRFSNAGMVISGGGVSHFTSVIANATLELGLLQENVRKLRQVYGGRVKAICQSLGAHLGAHVEFAIPGGGYFVWVKLNGNVDTEKLLPMAQEAGLSYRPGTAFSAYDAFSDRLRLAFALYEPEQLDEGVQRLATVLHRYESGNG
jgi:2-aminoadipate transaminase